MGKKIVGIKCKISVFIANDLVKIFYDVLPKKIYTILAP